ncbi:hypothetical protein [Sinorhizobium meliloti]|uniref:hypothetical protein n=1 Tax=Rhizobium meliloti TaxID=382 RepID=UPI000FD7BC44|nr:hypothetical protein [Sinorhizobium meliloti]RVN04639.1 hypothetical protein CN112_24950 [Sinorhizobium meliloti]
MIAAYTRIALRLFFFWMVMSGYVSQETADTFLLDEEMIRAIETTVGSISFALVELWHVLEAKWKAATAAKE